MSYSLSLERFVGRLAVVTGASSGIGKAITELLVKYGVTVAGIARRLDRLNDLSTKLSGAKGKLHVFQCDLTKQEQILLTFKRIIKELGPIHILVNNAGLYLSTDIIDGDIEKWKAVLDTNILAVAICTREAISSMKTHKIKGHIININSVAGHQIVDFPNMNVYAATKHAITALTETVRVEINRNHLPIKITSLSPGYVKTELTRVSNSEEAQKIVEQRPGLEANDIAEAALYVLATPEHVNVKELTVSVQGQDF